MFLRQPFVQLTREQDKIKKIEITLCVNKNKKIKIEPVETIPRKGSRSAIDTLIETVDCVKSQKR